MLDNIIIEKFVVKDIRFPTSKELDGSDAMNKDPDYSAAYVIIFTNDKKGPQGHGLTFTCGRGNELCVEAIKSLSPIVIGKSLNSIVSNFGEFWGEITQDSQLRWVGPEKGVIHLATGAIINAIWDLYAKIEGKPLWKLLVEMTADEIINCIDFRYITDALTKEDALKILKTNNNTKAKRIEEMLDTGYPAYTTSAGWLGYSDEKIRNLCKTNLADGWNHFKLKVGANLDDDMRRASIIREEIGPDRKLMIDANQVWDVSEAIYFMNHLKKYDPWWIEEPTSPDDILGHKAIADAIYPVKVATGESCQNRIIFKQLMQAKAIDFCQLDSCRLGGVNEVLAVLLLAKKFNIPVCPHAGGVGLCEYVQHISIFDYISVSATLDNRVLEYVDHLHEHFIDPVVIRNGNYQTPLSPGYSIEMKPESLDKYEFPKGAIWSK
tara:strand:- start:769 stop:2076 length:1308 start_codon:yes stop_codon:yes gene_type:complete